jgi:hypothetical protein
MFISIFPFTPKLARVMIVFMKKKNPAAQALGILGGKARLKAIGPEGFAEMGKKGGKGRLRTMTADERSVIATKASRAAAKARKQKQKQEGKA